MTLRSLLVAYFQDAFPGTIITFPNDYKDFKDSTTEVEGMYFLDVMINMQFTLPCMVYRKTDDRILVFCDFKVMEALRKLDK